MNGNVHSGDRLTQGQFGILDQLTELLKVSGAAFHFLLQSFPVGFGEGRGPVEERQRVSRHA
jgi:hypothetical protein